MPPPSDFYAAQGARICHGAPAKRAPTVATVLGIGLCAAFGVAHAEVPTLEDIAACNRQAEERSRSRSISPTPKDEAAADAARRQDPRSEASRGTAERGTQSPDPQIDGMDRDGAKDAAYRAAYRVCMRMKGF